MKKSPPWWQLPSLVGAGFAFFSVLAVTYVTYKNLPQQVEAMEQKNELQDDAILELKKSNEIWQNIYQQQQAPKGIQRLWDDAAEAWYCDDGRDQWWADREGRCE